MVQASKDPNNPTTPYFERNISRVLNCSAEQFTYNSCPQCKSFNPPYVCACRRHAFQPKSALLEGDGSEIVIEFDVNMSASAQGSQVPCGSVLVASNTSRLGSGAVCSWKTPSQFAIVPAFGHTVDVPSSLAVVGTLRSLTGLHTDYPSVELTLNGNAHAITATLAGPQQAGTCNATINYVVTSDGDAGKPLTLQWSVSALGVAGSATAAYLVTLNSGVTTTTLSVNTAYLEKGSYSVSGSVLNWLGATVTLEAIILNKTATAVPTIVLPVPSTIEHNRMEMLQVAAQVIPPTCQAGVSPSHILTLSQWTQIQGTPVPIADPNDMYLVVAADTLNATMQYSFHLNARVTNTLTGGIVGTANETIIVTVRSQPVTISIDGGSSRSVSKNHGEANVTLVAQATDPMYGPGILEYNWYEMGSGVASRLVARTASVNISKATLTAGVSYTYKAEALSTGSRKASSTVTLIAQAAAIPIVTVSRTGAAATAPVLVSDRLVLESGVDTSSASGSPEVDYMWTCGSGNLDLANRSLTLTNRTLASLVIAPNALQSSTTYRFTLTATYRATGIAGSATLELTTSPLFSASSATCSASPSSGTAMTTWYTLSCTGLAGGVAPYSYNFEAQPSISAPFTRIVRDRALNSAQTLLPAPSGNGEVLNLRARIVDGAGSAVYVAFSANVSQSVSLRLTEALLELNNTLESGDTQLYASKLMSIASYVNNASSAAVNKSETTTTRRQLVQSVSKLFQTQQTRNLSSLASSVSVVAGLLASATDYNNATELLPETQDAVARVLKDSVSSAAAAGSLDTASSLSVLAAASNLVSSSAAAVVSDGTRVSVSCAETIEDILHQVSISALSNAVVGEDPVLQDFDAATGSERLGIGLSGRIVEASSMSKQMLGSTLTGARVQLPQALANHSGKTLQVTMASIKGDALLPIDGLGRTDLESTGQNFGGSITVRVRDHDTGQAVEVLDLPQSDPFVLDVPTGYAINITGELESTACKFWNTTEAAWRSEGTRSVASASSGNARCETTHLTAFTVLNTFKSSRVEVNTLDESDIRDVRAWDPTQNIMALLLYVVLALFAAIYPVVAYCDRRDWELNYKERYELQFWRTANRMRLAKLQARDGGRFRQSLSYSIRRRHPWISPFHKPPADYINSRKRLLILLTLILNSVAICALLAGTDQRLPLLSSNISAALVGMLLSFPIPFVVSAAFERSTPVDLQVRVEASLAGTCIGALLLIMAFCLEDLDFEVEGDDEEKDQGDDGAAVDDDALENDDGGADDGAVEQDQAMKEDEEDEKTKEEKKKQQEMKQAHAWFGGLTVAAGATAGTAAGASSGPRAGAPKEQRGEGEILVEDALAEEQRDRSPSAMASSNPKPATRERRTMELQSSLHHRLSKFYETTGLRATQRKGEAESRAKMVQATPIGMSSSDTDSGVPPQFPLSVKPPVFCCFYSSNDPKLSVFAWTVQDLMGVCAAIIVDMGCLFLAVYLSWKYQSKKMDAVETFLMAIGQDFLFRFCTISTIEFLLLAPIVPACLFCFFRKRATPIEPFSDKAHVYHRDKANKSMRRFYLEKELSSDKNLFTIDEQCRIAKITPVAREIGLRRGWKILEVDGTAINSFQQLRTILHRIHLIKSHYTVLFYNQTFANSADGKFAVYHNGLEEMSELSADLIDSEMIATEYLPSLDDDDDLEPGFGHKAVTTQSRDLGSLTFRGTNSMIDRKIDDLEDSTRSDSGNSARTRLSKRPSRAIA